jgi:hypothetical protein
MSPFQARLVGLFLPGADATRAASGRGREVDQVSKTKRPSRRARAWWVWGPAVLVAAAAFAQLVATLVGLIHQ